MVKGFRCADTQALFETGKSKRFSNVAKVSTRKLAQLDAANTLSFCARHLATDSRRWRGIARVNTASGSMINSVFAFAGRLKVRPTLRLWTTTEGNSDMFKNGMRPVHPGEVLQEDFLKPLGLSANALAKALNVPAPRINDVVRKRRGVSADTAMRLARYFGGDARSWLNLQTAYDLRIAEISNAKRIVREVSPSSSAS
jgi:addiction module HigA family antidote